MGNGTLHIDLGAIARNWNALSTNSRNEAGAVVKADAYGLGIARVATRLAAEGARKFFVATAEEGAELRQILGPGVEIYVFSGHMPGDTPLIRDAKLIPTLNSVDQVLRHFEALTDAAFAVQLDSGMNRLGLEPHEWASLSEILLAQNPRLIMSHLACADEPSDPMNAAQLASFVEMTEGLNVPRSLSATGGIGLGAEYHFDLTRPGIGLYGGLPFIDAYPVVKLALPIIQTREVQTGEAVGYGRGWIAQRPSRVATLSGGYADGLIRTMSNVASLHINAQKVPLIGRVSMDMIAVDVTDVKELPESIDILGMHQSIDSLANFADTIGYEILTSLGSRYERVYSE